MFTYHIVSYTKNHYVPKPLCLLRESMLSRCFWITMQPLPSLLAHFLRSVNLIVPTEDSKLFSRNSSVPVETAVSKRNTTSVVRNVFPFYERWTFGRTFDRVS